MTKKKTKTDMHYYRSSVLPDIIAFLPTVHEDERGYFFESYNSTIQDLIKADIIQENHSVSKKDVLRGLHYQWDKPMGKLCRAVRGKLMDYVVDIRKDSDTYGKHDFFLLTAENQQQLWIPPGFAHGFVSLEDDTHLVYKCTAAYNKDCEGSIDPFDDELGIMYPIFRQQAIMSDKDKNSQSFADYKKDPKF